MQTTQRTTRPRRRRWPGTTEELSELRQTMVELYHALDALTVAAEAAGWDVDADNAPILEVARGARASAEPVVAATLPELEPEKE